MKTSTIASSSSTTTVTQLQQEIRAFVEARDWQQFHSPRNLAAAVSVEAGELLGHFRWSDAAESVAIVQNPAKREAIAHEVADVLILTLELAEVCGFDVATIIREKLELNSRRYPVEQARGRSEKYTELPGAAGGAVQAS
ncbi:MAG: nucleotide pyrophosphohydrolase [Planctomycetota bacterium]|nr:nucleotide pyrophosphohydrolase [Planctomycetota bacterium]